MDNIFQLKCRRCGQKSASIDESILCGGCRQENPYLMAASDPEPDTIESLHEAACKLTEMLDDSENKLAAAEARIAELLAREQREAERRKKQGIILDHAMRGLRHSAEHPDDGRMQAVRALAKHSERQAGCIVALEADNEHLLTVNAGLQKKLEGLIPALRDCVDALKLACRERTPAARRAAALLKEKE